MFITLSIYFVMLLILFWSYCGYTLMLYLIDLFNGSAEELDAVIAEGEWAEVLMIVPCYNEAAMITDKVVNIAAFDYPADKLRVIFVDGGSSDNTQALLAKALNHYPERAQRWQLIESAVAGKIAQMNTALQLRGDSAFIFCSDVDAQLEPDALKRMVQVLQQRPEVGVVGANILPAEAGLDIEKQFWRDQNAIRYLESVVHSSSIVVAPGYLFRVDLIASYPDDCVADDIFIAYSANAQGYRVEYLQQARGIETRVPATIRDYIAHKFRKGNAYLIELLRFTYQFPRFEPLWKVMFFTKLLQFLVCPWLIPYWLVATLSLLLGDAARQEIAILGVLFLFVSLVITSQLIGRVRRRHQAAELTPHSRRHLFSAFILNNLVMFFVALTFPFYQQNSRYRKVGSRTVGR
ncbi:MAG: glycosyltransferase [Gammaproteobacteria bacterium]|nr:glycosyltransferase [Gammaproteobacteria bacterium]